MRWLFLGVLGCTLACGARTQLPVDGDDGGSGGSTGSGASGPGGGGTGGGQGVGGVEQMALGAQHTCLRTYRGDVYCWGRNGNGQLGVGAAVEQIELPERVPLDAKATYLAAGTYHTCATLVDGRTMCWGKNVSGQVGVGSEAEEIFEPTQVPLDGVQALSLGEAHSCALVGGTAPLPVFCWGSGSDGQTGQPTETRSPAPLGQSAIAIAAGAFHT